MSKRKATRDTETVESEEKVIPVDGEEEADDTSGISDEQPVEDRASEESELEQLRAKVTELEDARLRALADFENYKKRMARQYDEVVRGANDRLLGDLLEVVDNFERALQHVNGGANDESLQKGTELIYSQMVDLLKRYDVEPIESVGQPFDPNLHEALMQMASDEYDEGVVVQELAKGYKQCDRVLRFAKVAVCSGKPSDEDSSDDQR